MERRKELRYFTGALGAEFPIRGVEYFGYHLVDKVIALQETDRQVAESMNDAQYLEWIAEHMVSFRPNTPNIATMIYIDKSGRELTHTYHDKESFNPPIVTMLRGAIDQIIRQSGTAVEECRSHG